MVTLVCAPAGFGKTTLLASWVRERSRDGAVTAWVTLDEHDNCPFVLWSAVLTALEQADPGVSLPWPPQRGDADRFAAELVDALARQRREIWLVLDDFQRLTESSPLGGLVRLLEQLPAGLHLMISSRVDPPLPLHRFRVAGTLRELRTAELSLTATEAVSVLDCHGVTLSQADLDRLMTRTEGWPVGIRLAALALSESDDPSATIESFAETDHAVADYLIAEVLATLPADLHEFLLRTSVCDSFTAELAGTLTGRDDAGALLARLEQSYALAQRCAQPGGWFRYHSLLAEHLRAALRRRSRHDLRELHRTAAHWFRDRDHPLTALEHAISGGDEDLMASVVMEQGPGAILGGQMWPLRRLAARLPPEVADRPGVGAMLAVADLATADRRNAEERLARLATIDSYEQRDRDLLLVALVHYARLTGGMPPQVERLNERLATIAHPDLRLLILVNRGTMLYLLGELRQARGDLTRALHLARQRGYDYAALHCLSHLSGLAGAEGDDPRMRRIAEEAIGFAAERGIADSPATCVAHAAAAWGAYQTLDDDTAQREAEAAIRLLGESNDRTVELAARTMMSIARFPREPRVALRAMRECWAGIDTQENVQPTVVAAASIAEQRMALRLGRPDWAVEAERRAASWIADSGDHLLLRARARVLHGQTTAARAELKKITTGEITCLLRNTEIEAHLLTALLAQRTDDDNTAGAELSTALEMAAPMGTLRPFLDAGPGPEVRALIAAHAGRLGWVRSFADSVLAAIPSDVNGIALSPREMQLLQELPSQSTLEQIATELYVSVNTVKTHVRSIYRKLDVTTRRDAVSTARQRGLL